MTLKSQRGLQGRLGYERTRKLVAVGGLTLLILLVVILAVRGVDRVEIVAALLYVPVFVALMAFGFKGGLIAGVLAAVAYGALRFPAAEIVGFDRFLGLIAFRSAAYIAFGTLGGWAAGQLESPLRKLEKHDLIDDESGLFNSRFFLRETAVEAARADRYGTSFSIVSFEVARNGSGKEVQRVGNVISRSLRTVDRAIHANTGDGSLFAAILPETPAEGASVVAEKIAESIRNDSTLSGLGAISHNALTYPADKETFLDLKQRFESVDKVEHPQEAPAEVPVAPDRRAPG